MTANKASTWRRMTMEKKVKEREKRRKEGGQENKKAMKKSSDSILHL